VGRRCAERPVDLHAVLAADLLGQQPSAGSEDSGDLTGGKAAVPVEDQVEALAVHRQRQVWCSRGSQDLHAQRSQAALSDRQIGFPPLQGHSVGGEGGQGGQRFPAAGVDVQNVLSTRQCNPRQVGVRP
jgi:hypothetical protein